MNSTTDISVGTLYELNQQLMEKEKTMSKSEIAAALQKVKTFFEKGDTYFMLLCHDQRDYTLFRKNNAFSSEVATKELELCLKNRGTLLSIDELPDGNFEIWLRIAGSAYCYYLFPYDEGVINC